MFAGIVSFNASMYRSQMSRRSISRATGPSCSVNSRYGRVVGLAFGHSGNPFRLGVLGLPVLAKLAQYVWTSLDIFLSASV